MAADLVPQISALLDRAQHFTYGDGGSPETGQALATEAVGRGLLALIPLVREIGDQLDTRRQPIITAEVVVDDHPRHEAAVLLEQIAIGDEGPQRERTVARLVLHDLYQPYDNAASIAHHALLGASIDRIVAVKKAIDTLGIEVQ